MNGGRPVNRAGVDLQFCLFPQSIAANVYGGPNPKTRKNMLEFKENPSGARNHTLILALRLK